MLIGIVGKPNCGKSTFFKAATLAEAEIAPYPFTTIKPNVAVGYVKIKCAEQGFGIKCNPKHGYCLNGWRFVPIQLIDVAGLVPGAHLGKGMGFQFLNDLIQADVLIHIIDISGSTNERGELVKPLSYDPANDIKFLEEELDFWYLDIIKRGWDKFVRSTEHSKNELKQAIAKQLSSLNVREEMVEGFLKNVDNELKDWDDAELLRLASYLRAKTKPMLVVCNKIDVPGSEKNFERLEKECKGYTFIPCSSVAELMLRELAKDTTISYIPGERTFSILDSKRLNEKQTRGLEIVKGLLGHFGLGVQESLNTAVFDVLEKIAIFPVANNRLEDKDGNKLPDCLLIDKEATALELAYKVHSDIGKNFIRAIDLKTKQVVGKEHKLKDCDVIEIVT